MRLLTIILTTPLYLVCGVLCIIIFIGGVLCLPAMWVLCGLDTNDNSQGIWGFLTKVREQGYSLENFLSMDDHEDK